MTPTTNPPVRSVGPGLWEIGEIRLDQAKKTLSFPAVVNLREGPLEYVLVTDYGKIHESLLRTTVPPYHIQMALILLGVPAAPLLPEANGIATNASQAAATVTNASNITNVAGRLLMEIGWNVRGRVRYVPLGNFVQNRRARTKVGKGDWFFMGSRLREGGFAAQADGSIVTLIDDPDAIVGSHLPGSDDDDNWLAIGRRMPPLETAVEVRFTCLPSRAGN